MSSTVSRTVERPIGLIMIMKSAENCDNQFFFLDKLDLIKMPFVLSQFKIKTSSSKTHLIFDCLLFHLGRGVRSTLHFSPKSLRISKWS